MGIFESDSRKGPVIDLTTVFNNANGLDQIKADIPQRKRGKPNPLLYLVYGFVATAEALRDIKTRVDKLTDEVVDADNYRSTRLSQFMTEKDRVVETEYKRRMEELESKMNALLAPGEFNTRRMTTIVAAILKVFRVNQTRMTTLESRCAELELRLLEVAQKQVKIDE